jgi:hypothetical protein
MLGRPRGRRARNFVGPGWRSSPQGRTSSIDLMPSLFYDSGAPHEAAVLQTVEKLHARLMKPNPHHALDH